jgi:hypothetical protein
MKGIIMCYTGKCSFEDHMGGCTQGQDEKEYLLQNFGFSCLIPMAPEEEDLPFKEAIQALYDYRAARAIARKLSQRY